MWVTSMRDRQTRGRTEEEDPMDLGVKGKSFLIVGGTAGIGLASARALAADGANVAVLGRDGARAEAVPARLTDEFGTRVAGLTGDVAADQSTVDGLVAGAAEQVGPLDGLTVTAGSNRDAHSTLEDATDEIWERSCQEQLMGTVRVVKAALPALQASGGGTIVTMAAYSIHSPHHNRMPYVAFKAALVVHRGNDSDVI